MTSSQKTAVLTVARRDVGIKTRKQIELPAEQSVKNLMTHAQSIFGIFDLIQQRLLVVIGMMKRWRPNYLTCDRQ